MLDMVGVGPFITLPLILGAMGGPQAMLGWLLGAIIAICDGLVWAELGASMPEAGGSYVFLRNIFSGKKGQGIGRLLAFLFIWQLSFSGPLSIASGCIGLSQYAAYLFPALLRGNHSLAPHISFGPITLVAMAACVLAVILLWRNIQSIGKLSLFLWRGVMAAMALVIVTGLTHFHASLAFTFPAGAFQLSPAFFTGLGSAMLIATYDYWGYYNVCFLGGEIKDPTRTIPRAIVISIVLVAVLYLVMNISVIGVVPWQQIAHQSGLDSRRAVISVMMEQAWGGHIMGKLAAALIIWTAFASVFSLLLGYSRVPYAAARDGNYFGVFGRLHAQKKFPYVSLLVLGGVAACFCLFDLKQVIAALVVIRIVMQFLLQQIGLLWLRWKRPDVPRPFRMWLYPVPALLAAAGFLYILFLRPGFARELLYAAALILVGCLLFWLREKTAAQSP